MTIWCSLFLQTHLLIFSTLLIEFQPYWPSYSSSVTEAWSTTEFLHFLFSLSRSLFYSIWLSTWLECVCVSISVWLNQSSNLWIYLLNRANKKECSKFLTKWLLTQVYEEICNRILFICILFSVQGHVLWSLTTTRWRN